MDENIKLGLVMLGRPQFDISLAQQFWGRVKTALESWGIDNIVALEEPVTRPQQAISAAQKLQGKDLDAVLVVQGTFTDASLILNLTRDLALPLLIWAIKEEPTGERLRLNSFCGLNLAAHALTAAGRKFKGIYGEPDTPQVQREILAFIRAAAAIRWLKGKKLGIVGQRPPGYYTSNFDEIGLYTTFGISVEYIPLFEVFSLADKINLEEQEASLTSNLDGYKQVEAGAVQKSLQGYLALRRIAIDKALDALAIECWPDFMVTYGGAACFALGKLNDEGIVAACEADVNGAITMLLAHYWSDKATFLADLVVGDKEKNELIFWHCGGAPPSLIARNLKPVASVHPNRKVPLSLYFPLREGETTISRLSPGKDGRYRILLGKGIGLQTPLLFSGNTLLIRLERPVTSVLDTILSHGFEHHYIIAYGDLIQEWREFARLLDLEIVEF
ncbi:L-fucose isomerase [Thermanaeromonas toyohensis ToBE]|uniref:L-fucose isomerase n=1 Tax=Thermanaeromonas toyohensis ToBE TaxID=698762 RepID=A0A1W1VVC1_9FIRM|nr:L-fucose/L-arabinose isomerase family protein [Thermanaeromonas toyohensis]SMB97298.1 L-fucose isomerase [Thermanaeromonas toyohensis ToBE]